MNFLRLISFIFFVSAPWLAHGQSCDQSLAEAKNLLNSCQGRLSQDQQKLNQMLNEKQSLQSQLQSGQLDYELRTCRDSNQALSRRMDVANETWKRNSEILTRQQGQIQQTQGQLGQLMDGYECLVVEPKDASHSVIGRGRTPEECLRNAINSSDQKKMLTKRTPLQWVFPLAKAEAR